MTHIPQKNSNHSPINEPTKFNGALTKKIIIKDDYCRSDKTCALYCQVFLNGSRKKININTYIEPKYFDKEKQRIRKTYSFHKELNLVIEKFLADINRIEINYRLSDKRLTLDLLVEELQNPTSRICFIKFWEHELTFQEKQIKASTLRQQTSDLNKLKKYRSTILFSELSIDLINDIKHWARKKEKNEENTIIGFVKNIKKYVNIAKKRGVSLEIDPVDIKNKSYKNTPAFLCADEVGKLHSYYLSEFISTTHKNVLGRFLFSCFTGLRISDNFKLTNDDIFEGYLLITIKKTEKVLRLKLNNTALDLIADGILNVKFTPEYTNRTLKEIQKFMGIKKNITFHLSRHTFATNFYIQTKDLTSLQRFLGHSKIEQTMIYTHIAEDVSNSSILAMDNLIKKPLL